MTNARIIEREYLMRFPTISAEIMKIESATVPDGCLVGRTRR